MNIFTALDILSSGNNSFFPFAAKYNKINHNQMVNADSIITAADRQEIIEKINQASSLKDLQNATELEKVELKFIPDFSPIKFPKYTITNGKANVNLFCEIPGKVIVPNCEMTKEMTIDGKIFRNYSIIHDGKLNMPSLCVIMDNNTFDTFIKAGVKINKSPVIILDLTQFDLNIDTEINLERLFELECHLYINKVINKIYKSQRPSITETYKIYVSPEFTEFLVKHGFKDGVFSPKMVIVEKNKDVIPERQIKISIVSCSNIPTVKSVEVKLSNSAKLTKSDTIMAALLNKTFDMNDIKVSSDTYNKESSKMKYAMLMSGKTYNTSIDTTIIDGFPFNGTIS